jgi:hypothetical protein
MGARAIIGAVLAFAAFGTSIESRAEGYSRGYHRHKRYSHYRSPHRYRSYSIGVGGRHFGYQEPPFVWTNNGYNYPGFYNNQTFWERVETQPEYPVK